MISSTLSAFIDHWCYADPLSTCGEIDCAEMAIFCC